MKTSALLALAVVAGCALSLPAEAQSRGRTCVVADPSGTPLNLRDVPNGPIIGTISNGTWVLVREIERSQGKAWAFVHDSDREGRMGVPLGYVFYNYLNCR